MTAPDVRLRVLVADDEDAVCRAICRMLEGQHFDVVAVGSGRQAIELFERSVFDVVLTDLHMPDGSGIDLLRAIRRVNADIPVVLMSGMTDVLSTALEYGAFRLLTKPIMPEILGKTIRVACRAHELMRLHKQSEPSQLRDEHVPDGPTSASEFERTVATTRLSFQPVIDAATGTAFAQQALLRSDDSVFPMPHSLSEEADRLGWTPVVGRHLRSLCAAALRDASPSTTLFVAVHAKDLFDVELFSASAPLSDYAPRVFLDIKEQASSITDSLTIVERLRSLREMGFRLSVDEVGESYSGLTSFVELAPEIAKISSSLVRDVDRSNLKQRTIATLCRLCHDVGCRVVASGVEKPAERAAVVQLGCDYLQGDLVGPPGDLPSDAEAETT